MPKRLRLKSFLTRLDSMSPNLPHRVHNFPTLMTLSDRFRFITSIFVFFAYFFSNLLSIFFFKTFQVYFSVTEIFFCKLRNFSILVGFTRVTILRMRWTQSPRIGRTTTINRLRDRSRASETPNPSTFSSTGGQFFYLLRLSSTLKDYNIEVF